MKTKLNIALEGTCNGDVMGGLLLWTGKTFRRFPFILLYQRISGRVMRGRLKQMFKITDLILNKTVHLQPHSAFLSILMNSACLTFQFDIGESERTRRGLYENRQFFSIRSSETDQYNHILYFLNDRCKFWVEHVREIRRSDPTGYLGVCKGESAECRLIRNTILYILEKEE